MTTNPPCFQVTTCYQTEGLGFEKSFGLCFVPDKIDSEEVKLLQVPLILNITFLF